MRIPTSATASGLSLVIAAATLLSSCAVTTESVNGTSETMINTAEATSDFSSSTSPRGDAASNDQKALQFARTNLERVKMDMALGGGEHLAALGKLLGVSDSGQDTFFVFTRRNFGTLAGSERTTAEELVAKLDAELTANPQLRN